MSIILRYRFRTGDRYLAKVGPKSHNSDAGAPKARNMKARGKREAKRSASPLDSQIIFEESTESAKYHCWLLRSFQSFTVLMFIIQGRRARFASHLPLAFIFRAFGAARTDFRRLRQSQPHRSSYTKRTRSGREFIRSDINRSKDRSRLCRPHRECRV